MKTIITLGPEGSYHSLAVKKLHKNCKIIYQDSFEGIIDCLFKTENAYAVFAITNSITGEISQSKKVLDKYSQSLVNIQAIDIQINHALIGLENSDASKVKTVISHPQVLKQCSKFIKAHKLKTVSTTSSSQAVQDMLKIADETVAALAAQQKIKKTKILQEQVQNSTDNSTTFLEVRVK